MTSDNGRPIGLDHVLSDERGFSTGFGHVTSVDHGCSTGLRPLEGGRLR